MKLTLMLMGGSAFLLIGILGIFYGASGETMNILEIAQLKIPTEMQRIFFPMTFVGFGVLGALFPSIHGALTVMLQHRQLYPCFMQAY